MKKTTKLLLVLSLALLLALSSLALFACKPTGDPKLDVTVASNTDVKVGDSLDSVKQYLTVEYTDSSNKTSTVTDYELQGTLTEGQPTLTVKYQGLTATCRITVKANAQPSDDKPTKYIVTFNTNGGSVINQIEVGENTTIIKPTDPVKDGYEFLGWCKDEKCTLEWNFATDTVTQDVTLHAKWKAKSYLVTFVAEGNTVSTQEYTVEKKNIIEPSVPVKEGYTGKWEEYALTTGNIEVSAVYTAKTYTVILNYNGATENNTQQTITVIYDKAVGELPEPEKTGYYFYGWRYASELITSSTIWKFDVNDATLTVKWQAKIYTVTFVGEKLTITQNYTVENKPAEPAVPVKVGYNGVWEDYALTTGDITVNAVYTAKQYDVVLDYNGATGNNAQQSITVTYDEVIGALPTPTKTGYVFEGWKYNGDIVTASTVWKTDTTSAITFTADWSGPYYTVTFDSNGGSEVSNLTNVLSGSLITEPQTPTKDMADFSGWYSDGEFTNEWNFETNTVSDNITLYAKWLNYTQGLIYTLNSDNTAYSVAGLGTAQDSDIIITPVYNGKPVTSIINPAFKNCNSVQSVIIPDSVTSIGDYAFSNCSRLTSITIGNSVKTIGSYAFQSCSSLTSVTIPESVMSVKSEAFYKCNNLVSVYYTGNIDGWCKIGFGSNYANPVYYADEFYIDDELVTNLEITDTVTTINNYALAGCTSVTSVSIGGEVISIGNHAFYECIHLTIITFNGTIEQWNAISKGSNWKYKAPATKVVCTDGEVAL